MPADCIAFCVFAVLAITLTGHVTLIFCGVPVKQAIASILHYCQHLSNVGSISCQHRVWYFGLLRREAGQALAICLALDAMFALPTTLSGLTSLCAAPVKTIYGCRLQTKVTVLNFS